MRDEDKAAGRTKQAKGKINEVAGAAKNDRKKEFKGKAQQVAGKAQEKMGKAKS